MQNSVTQLVLSLRAWPSVAVFFLLRHGYGDIMAITAALMYALGFLVLARRHHRQSALDLAVLCSWVIWLAAFALAPLQTEWHLNHHFTTLLYLCLLGAAVAPPLLGKEPFTSAFARRRTDPAVWQSRQFRRINLFMSAVWAVIFSICALLSLLPDPRGKLIAPALFAALAGIPFTRKFPAWYLAMDARLANPTASPEENPVIPTAGEASAWPANHPGRAKIAAGLGPIKKALVIFGSPRKEKGHTHAMLDFFLQGLRDHGVELETVLLAEKNIRPCCGCFSCWTTTPGVCIHQDDMAGLLQKEQQADLIVFAQPLYVFSVPAITKNYLDRRLPQLLPYLVEGNNGTTTHPPRWPRSNPARLLIFSVCGFPEVSHFAGLLTMFRQLAATANTIIVGELLRPASESLRFGGKRLPVCDRVTAALYAAGCQVAQQGYINKETEAVVSQPLVADRRAFHRVANTFWDSWIAYEHRRKLGTATGTLSEHLTTDAALFFAGMAARFRPEATDGPPRAIQFHLTDQEPGDYYLHMDKDGCTATPGKAEKPALTIHTPWQTWLDIAAGRLSGQQALIEGRYRIEGDINLLQKMGRIFR